MQGGPPDTLTVRHQLAASLRATGMPLTKVAALVGMAYNRLAIVSQHPDFRAIVATEAKALRERLLDSKHEELVGLWPKAMAAKEYCLDQREQLAVANAAADSIFDRVVPRRRVGDEGGERTLHVKLTAETVAAMRAALAEDPEPEAIDVTPEPPDEAA